MIVPVILAGGVGSRLWPVSRKSYPKQFISFSDSGHSLFQEAVLRLNGLDTAPPIVVCSDDHRFLVAEQLRQLGVEDADILLEPMGKNTAPAVALAAMLARRNRDDCSLLILAADHVIGDLDAFHQAIKEGERQSRRERLVTFGIVPDRPETGYGYIHRGEQEGAVFSVDRFVEKPDADTAQAYLESGDYYWNSGMFMFSPQTYLVELGRYRQDILLAGEKAFAALQQDMDFWRIPRQEFADCPSESIDYAVMEHTEKGVVLPLDADWNDLGAWSALWGQGRQDENGNVVKGDAILHGVSNSYIHAESRLVSVLGMDDAVVVETRDGILVSNKSQVQDVKALVKMLEDAQRPEVESHRLVFRPWGSYESLESDAGFQVKRIIVNPGQALSLQMHHYRAEHWIVVKGTAKVTCGEKEFLLHENESTFIPLETKHRLENPGDEAIELIEVQCGSYLGEDDIVRFDDVYGR